PPLLGCIVTTLHPSRSSVLPPFFRSSCSRRGLHSFPTRRSSDLGEPVADPQPILKRLDGIVLLDGSWKEAKTLWWRNPWLLKLQDRKSTRLNSSHVEISYAVFCLKKKIQASLRS